MSEIAIKVENLSKAYQLGDFSTGTLSRDIHRWWSLLRGKEDPFLQVGETNDRTRHGTSDVVWSLKDINFDIKQGDAVGIVGRNGAGKSTLLKVLSRVTTPTTGNVKVKGRIASLLEVGTGFHPELTGRENIFLNGAILGMRKAEIKRHFDAIVDFAGVERYIDTPVKRYSSGMYVRLAFAVAAYLESEILIVDEVLAVGDAEFQKKCLGKMGDVSRSEGRTILFVSHNMAAVRELCTYGVLLQNGEVIAKSNAEDVIARYQSANFVENKVWQNRATTNGIASFTRAYITDAQGAVTSVIDNEANSYINLEVEMADASRAGTIAFEVRSSADVSIYCSHDYDSSIKPHYVDGHNRFQIKLPAILRPGLYYINLGINGRGFTGIDYIERAISFEVIGAPPQSKPLQDNRPGMLYVPLQWETI